MFNPNGIIYTTMRAYYIVEESSFTIIIHTIIVELAFSKFERLAWDIVFILITLNIIICRDLIHRFLLYFHDSLFMFSDIVFIEIMKL